MNLQGKTKWGHEMLRFQTHTHTYVRVCTTEHHSVSEAMSSHLISTGASGLPAMMKRSLRSTSPDCLNSNCTGTLTQSPAGITPCVCVCVCVCVRVCVCVTQR